MEDRVYKRHLRIWSILVAILRRWIFRKFNFSHDEFDFTGIEGPILVIPNHSCAWDPLLVAMALRKRQVYFVASEHILRWRVIGPIINWLVAPIPRKKASSGSGTVMACLRHLKAGHSVCLFAEGEQTWDGVTKDIFPATGKLIRSSGATLVTYRLDGAYLSMPRWASDVRKGKVYGHVVGIYTPEMLKAMKPGEINDAINRDIYIDTWQWQQEQPEGPVAYISAKKKVGKASGLQKALFICPQCAGVGKLHTRGDIIACRCGFAARYLDTGFLEPNWAEEEREGRADIRTIADWDAWEIAEMKRLIDSLANGEKTVLFSDTAAQLSQVGSDHSDRLLGEGPLEITIGEGKASMHTGEMDFDLGSIDMMAPILSNRVLFSTGGQYYQILADNTNMRKYVLAWQHIHASAVNNKN